MINHNPFFSVVHGAEIEMERPNLKGKILYFSTMFKCILGYYSSPPLPPPLLIPLIDIERINTHSSLTIIVP